ncbi:MAG: NAD(P)-dependent oxidoreductase [Verrucomicrobiales bacterium]|nr:NAD(P)-dependent oxidoreductase [Verrucomicrobiales bacterium]
MPFSPDGSETSSIAAVKKEVGERDSIGLIGLGLMGSAMGERLLAHGFTVQGFDIDPGCLAAFVTRGGRAATSVTDLITSCRRIILSLPDSEVVRTVLDELQPLLRPGQVILDTTTGRPEAAAAAGRRLAGHRVAYVEATISGNSSQVRRGEVLAMTSGTAAAAALCNDMLVCFARKIHHVGDWGSAAKLKLVSNLVLGLNRAVLAEGLAFAGKLHLDLEQTLVVLRDSMSYSRVMDTKGDKMIAADFEPQARLSQHLKDVRLIQRAAELSHARIPLTDVHAQLLQQAESKGLGPLDNCAIIRVFEAVD